jgi:hypothetical protein
MAAMQSTTEHRTPLHQGNMTMTVPNTRAGEGYTGIGGSKNALSHH